jgi:polysaccharide pyruvyl transferase WcaK-like protein
MNTETVRQEFAPIPDGKTVVVGAYGTGNLGDEIILSGMIWFLTKHQNYDKRRITVFSRDPLETSNLHGIRARRRNIVDILCSHQVIIGGGQLLQDMADMALRFSLLALVATLFGKRVSFYGVGVSTMHSRVGRFLTRISGNAASEIYVRDPFSRTRLMELGVDKEINVCSDLSFYAPEVSGEIATRLLREEGIEPSDRKVLIALIWQYGDSRTAERLAQFLPNFVKYVLAKYRETYVIFVPLNRHKDIPADQDIIYG